MTKEFTFIFVCQAGELELKACLLAASLRHFLGSSVSLLAAIPEPAETWGEISVGTRSLLSQLDVATSPIRNPINTGYPIGNKLAALSLHVDTSYKIFLDSDILCMRPFDPAEQFSHPISAKPADVNSFSDDEDVWRQAYAACNVDYQPGRLVVASHSKHAIPPYYNAGVIGCESTHPFAGEWINCCQSIEDDEQIANKRPWLDQVGLPVAAARTRAAIHGLPDEMNYPAHLAPLKPGEQVPTLCHYHWPGIIAREPEILALVRLLSESHAHLADLLRQHTTWRIVADLLDKASGPFTGYPVQPADDFIISGIPRSGTSLLCKALDMQDNCVVVNEPAEIFNPLRYDPYLHGIRAYYKDLRRDICVGKPIPNKLSDGELTTDTAIAESRDDYFASVDSFDFALGTKNTLSYLLRSAQLRRRIPHLKWILCIRHPYNVISSWKSTFPHLEGATVETFPVGFPNDPNCDTTVRRRLQQIATQDDVRVKRALLWRLLADLIHEDMDKSLVIRLEKLLSDPTTIINRALDYIGYSEGGTSTLVLPPIHERPKPLNIDAEEKRIVDDICGPAMAQFGYSTDENCQLSMRSL